MKKNVLIICDPDERYCKKLDGFLRSALRIPFEIESFTKAEHVKDFKNKEEALLVISDQIIKRDLIKGFKNILVLEDKPLGVAEEEASFGTEDELNIKRTAKYQSSEKIAESVLSMCLEMPGISASGIRTSVKHEVKMIGFYTPDKDVLQTEISLDFAKEAGYRKKLIYFSNDPFCTNKNIRGDSYEDNLSDLMYYAQCEEDRFSIYLEKTAKRLGNIEYIPLPEGQIRDCGGEDYIRLLRNIENCGNFEAVVADFAEPFRDMTEVFNMMDIVFVLLSSKTSGKCRGDLFKNEIEKMDIALLDKLCIIDAAAGKELAGRYIKEIWKEKQRP